jgi:putative ABC transport system substrate-binding protein
VKRRDFITLLGGAATWPLAARAQQPGTPVIGFMSSRSPEDSVTVVAAFHRGLGEGGLIEGKNVITEFRWARGEYDQLPALAAELVSRQVAVLVAAGGDPSARAAKAATTTIPIVFGSGDPIKFPPAARQALELAEAARTIDRPVVLLNASTDAELDAAFATLARQSVVAMLVAADPFFDTRRDQIIAFAAQQKLPAIYHFREYAVAGGLMSYGVSLSEAYRGVGTYAARIVNGEKPTNLPVMQSVKFELVINLKTAKTLGFEFPPTFSARADEVIE